jgi:hypothetical protein
MALHTQLAVEDVVVQSVRHRMRRSDGVAQDRLGARTCGAVLGVKEGIARNTVLDAQIGLVALPADLEGRSVDTGVLGGPGGLRVKVRDPYGLGSAVGLGEALEGPLVVCLTGSNGAVSNGEHVLLL